MATIIHIETSTDICSAALSQDGECLFHEQTPNANDPKENRGGPNHARALAPMVERMVSMADSHAIPIDAVAVSGGPGSYTGLRIGASTAKGLCYGRQLRLISVPTLQLLCTPVLLYQEDIPQDALMCPMIDARRMEVYAAIYDRALKEVRAVGADIVTADTYLPYLEKGPVCFFGNGAEKCRTVITHPNAIFIPDIVPLAKNMVPLAERAFLRGQFEDTAYYEPFYLKDFVAGTPRQLFPQTSQKQTSQS